MIRIFKTIAALLFSEAGVTALLGDDDLRPEQPILTAAGEGDVLRVQTLLAAYSDPNARDKRKQTPLMRAARNGHLDVVEVLLAAGADVNAKAKKGVTAFDAARDGSHEAVLQRLEFAADSGN